MAFGLYDRIIWHADAATGYWADQSYYSDTTLVPVDDPTHLQFNTVQVVFDRTSPAGVTDDVMLFDLTFTSPLLGAETSYLSSAEMATIETELGTWWTSWKAQTPSTITLKEYRWHNWHVGITKPGPAVRVTTVGTVATGSGTSRLPDQVAHSITFRTASRRHWGRCYTPALVPSALSAYGRLSDAQTDSRLANWETLLEACDTMDVAGDGVTPVVYSRTGQALLTIDVIAMDSTCDVIRSRRAKHPSKFATASS